MALDFIQREEQDQFFWYINDLIKKARSGYGGPSTYEEWLDDNPNESIQKWLDEEAKRYVNTKQLQTDWEGYHHNPSEDTLNLACQHCYENILKDALVVIEQTQATAFADAVREVLPKQLRGPIDSASYALWIDYTQAIELLEALTGKRYARESVRRMAYKETLVRHPKMRGRVSRDSCIGFANEHLKKRN